MDDEAHILTDKELEKMERHLSSIYSRANNEIGETRRHPRIVCQKVMTYGASMEMDTGPLTLYANELPVLIRHSPEMEYNISFHGVGDVIVYEPEEGCNEKM